MGINEGPTLLVQQGHVQPSLCGKDAVSNVNEHRNDGLGNGRLGESTGAILVGGFNLLFPHVDLIALKKSTDNGPGNEQMNGLT